MKSTLAIALAGLLGSGLAPAAAAAAPAPAFRSVSYDVSLTPDFATGVVTGAERIRFQSLTDGLDALSFTANSLAVNATLENAAANHVSERIAVSTTDVAEIAERFPLVLANIEARVLVPLAHVISERVAPGGKLFLSGLLQQDMERMLSAYQHMKVLELKEAGDWRALLLEQV